MAGLQELDFAELALLVELLDVEILARIDDRLGHHVFQAGLLHEIHDLLALREVRGHRHRAGDVLAGFQRGDGLPAVIGDRRIDVDHIDLRVLQQVLEFLIALLDSESSPTASSFSGVRWQMAAILAFGCR